MARLGTPAAAPAASAGEVLGPLAEVAAAQALPALARRLEGLRALLADDLAALEAELAGLTAACRERPGGPAGLAAAHLLGRPGKLIRPICALLAGRLGPRPAAARARQAALAAELVHAATLLHDDVIDEGPERRGAAAARVVWGNSASILAGDHLLTRALAQVAGALPEALDPLLTVIGGMVAAESLQLGRRGRLELDRDGYLRVLAGKTAALFSWALVAGGQAGGASAPTLDRLKAIGRHLGTAFQLTDDVLDLAGEATLTGKARLADLRQGKLTWPVMVACEADPSLLEELRSLCAGDADAPMAAPTQAAWVERLLATDALDITRAFARAEAEAALAEVARLPAGAPRAALAEVVAAAVGRAG